MNKIVVSAIIENEEGEVLAVRLDKEKKDGVWVPPGGKLEKGETLRQGVEREVEEELGVDIEVGEIVGISEVNYGGDENWVFVLYSAEIVSGEPKPMEEGKTLETKYIEKEKLEHYSKIRWLRD